jgi:hypothetical protein
MIELFEGAHVRLYNGVEVKGVVKCKYSNHYGLNLGHPSWDPDGVSIVTAVDSVVEILNKPPQPTFEQLHRAGKLKAGMVFKASERQAKVVSVDGQLFVGWLNDSGKFKTLFSLENSPYDNSFSRTVLVEEVKEESVKLTVEESLKPEHVGKKGKWLRRSGRVIAGTLRGGVDMALNYPICILTPNGRQFYTQYGVYDVELENDPLSLVQFLGWEN